MRKNEECTVTVQTVTVKCDGKVKFNLPGGIYKNNPSVFEDMERLGCQNIEEEDKTGKWFACFDFEAY